MLFNNIHKSYVARFLQDLQFFGAITIPYFIDWLQIDYTRIFILQAWFVIWVVLLEIPTGIVADKYGRRVSLSIGVLLFGMDLLIFGFTRNYYVLYLAEFLGAIGFTLISGADKALLYDSLLAMNKQDEGKYYLSRYEAAGTFGILLSFPLGSLIAGSAYIVYPCSLAITFILSGIFSLLAVIFYLLMNEPERVKPTENFVKLGLDGLRQVHGHRTLRVFALNSILLSSITFFMFWFYQPLAGKAGIDISYYGFIGAGFNLFGMLLLLYVEKLENILGINNILFYSALIPALLFITLAIIDNVYFVLFAIFMITGLKQLRAPILSDFMNQHIESRNRATVLSSVSLLERFMIALLYPVAGFLADMSLEHALLFLGAVALIFTFITKIEESHIS